MLCKALTPPLGVVHRSPMETPRFEKGRVAGIDALDLAGGRVHGASDRIGAFPRDGRVWPQDLAATDFHCLGFGPGQHLRDPLRRPVALTQGEVLRQVLGPLGCP